MVFSAAARGGEPGDVGSDSSPRPARFEAWAGGQAFRHAWSLYSGTTAAWSGTLHEDGVRVRAVGGYGAYSYSGLRATASGPQIVDFDGATTFADLLLGYQKQVGSLTVKGFAGLMFAHHETTPGDPETSIRGAGLGGKIVLEGWWTISERLWSSVDVSWGSVHDSYGTRGRVGWRVLPAISLGLEAGAAGNLECDIARAGGFLRYEWSGGELSASAGLSSDTLLDSGPRASLTQSSTPFATLSLLTRF
jgi:hypothetical protein